MKKEQQGLIIAVERILLDAGLSGQEIEPVINELKEVFYKRERKKSTKHYFGDACW